MQATTRRGTRTGSKPWLGTVLAIATVAHVSSALSLPDPVARPSAMALGDAPLSRRLAALDDLRTDGSPAAVAALDRIAREGDLRIRVAACATLGRLHTESSRETLRAVAGDGAVEPGVRMAAASVLAGRWRDARDIAFVERRCEGAPELAAHCATLRAEVPAQ